MAGVFSRDIWRLLFKSYLGYRDAAAMEHVSKRMREFMTDEQRFLVDAIYTSKKEYRVECTKRLREGKKRYDAQIKLIKARENYGKGTCTICNVLIKIKKIGKHQRAHKNVTQRHDKCETCGMERPKLDMYHSCQGYQSAHLQMYHGGADLPTACIHCGLRLRPELFVAHHCPLVPTWCPFCTEQIPNAVSHMHRVSCPSKCQHARTCYVKSETPGGYCPRHAWAQHNRCQKRTKVGSQCTRRAKQGHVMCAQHLNPAPRTKRPPKPAA